MNNEHTTMTPAERRAQANRAVAARNAAVRRPIDLHYAEYQVLLEVEASKLGLVPHHVRRRRRVELL